MAESISHDTEMASVLFADMVASTTHPMEGQAARLRLLQRIVKDGARSVLARSPDKVIEIPTGDGIALVFFRNPVLPAMCALEIASALRHHPEITVRMGVHMGPVYRHLDIKEQVNVVGGGINTAQRIMDCGDGGHILLSHSVADVLEQFVEWRDCLRDLGIHEVKNGARVHLYNLCKNGLGNPDTPKRIAVTVSLPPPAAAARSKISGASRRKWLWGGSIALVLAIAGLVIQQKSGIFHFGAKPVELPTAASTSSPPIVPVTVADASQFTITLDDDVPADGSGSQTLSFTVRDDVKVGDTVVVAKGAKATGSVLWAKKMLGIFGKKMSFRLSQADAADGQKLKIRATLKHAGKGPDSRALDTGNRTKSKDLAAAKGTEYIGYVDGEQTVLIRK